MCIKANEITKKPDTHGPSIGDEMYTLIPQKYRLIKTVSFAIHYGFLQAK